MIRCTPSIGNNVKINLVQEIGDYTVDQVMLRLENVNAQHKLVTEIGNFAGNTILSRIKDFLPHHNSCAEQENILRKVSDKVRQYYFMIFPVGCS